MGGISLAVEAESLISLNFSLSIVALRLNHSLQRHMSFPITSPLAGCRTPAIAQWHLACHPHPQGPTGELWQCPASLVSALKGNTRASPGTRSGM